MRRVILSVLRCPRCLRGALLPETDTAELTFGPLHCPECQALFPVGEGVADLVGDRAPSRGLQRTWELPLVARSYERYVRPWYLKALSPRPLDRDSEYLLYRSLLGRPEGPVLDLGCGTGLFARRLAQEPGFPQVVGMDVSKPMLEEAVAQAREAGATLDLLRAEAPELPFQDGSLAAILQASSLQQLPDAGQLFREVARALRPGGRYVLSTTLPQGRLRAPVQRWAGLVPRSEQELRTALSAAGLGRIERVLVAPLIVIRAEKPSRERLPGG